MPTKFADNSVKYMKIDPGDMVIYLEENNLLQSGIFVGFINISKKKAMIFTGSKYKTVATKKLIQVTVLKLQSLADQLKIQLKAYLNRNHKVIPQLPEE